ncbi:anaerobic ribonucleoside-triphosphate reductase activating protein [Arcanobacterium wilhelmae]|uniref:Anaerobic ribonucleoside-triphosphate reductase-activating protein n=1 Tax=Arcanobacterium wilhelmae TaxID=1803177 RepID=A0ABT9NBE9_9ACTO|nr:anaerobic ribonucleoside-triphosphate reductase activating protein [Arcanobacterium wilhelmae]MDP9801038.1 anaerobic ribonucleoside-triphosphate reductase activating protein [Arcanobacterium wilhelmae]WFN90396.1 anaerobic ribonucleoside-triphosphate reductase activating protein [Arcanobacterium wilhelmae]
MRIDDAGVRQPERGEWRSDRLSRGRIADYKPFNFVDGEGVRCSIYVSGCPFKCPGCYNVAAQSFMYGTEFTRELEERIFVDLAQPYVAGLSFLGGEPMLATGVLLPIARRLRAEFGAAKTIWTWSGYTFEQLQQETADKRELLALTDVLVDGPFLQAQYISNLAFRGSTNQRILNVPASLKTGNPIPYEAF